MAKILDVLSSDITVAGESEFAVDGSVAEVAVEDVGADGLDFANANGEKWFAPGDNVIFTEIICSIPYGFGPGTGQTQIGIVWRNDEDQSSIIEELAGNSVVTLPNLCALDIPPAGLFIPGIRDGDSWKLNLSNIVLNVSQLNVPDLLADGTVIKVQFHIKLYHTLPMSAAPA